MGMTRREYLAKQEIRKILAEEGYPTYSYLIQDFDIHLTKDPNVVGYMIPSQGIITVNEGLDLSQVSVIVRHEILHEYLNHGKRFENMLGQDEYNRQMAAHNPNMNIAGDYEISNRGYTERDKKNVRNIRLNNRLLKGLVTEDDHPDWVGLSAEEMYNRLSQDMKNEKNDMKNKLKLKKSEHSSEYVSTYNDVINSLDYDAVSDQYLSDLLKELKGE